MILKKLFTVLPYGETIRLFNFCSNEWVVFAEFTNSEALENLILNEYGDYYVFNHMVNYSGHMITIYDENQKAVVEKLNNKSWAFDYDLAND